MNQKQISLLRCRKMELQLTISVMYRLLPIEFQGLNNKIDFTVFIWFKELFEYFQVLFEY